MLLYSIVEVAVPKMSEDEERLLFYFQISARYFFMEKSGDDADQSKEYFVAR